MFLFSINKIHIFKSFVGLLQLPGTSPSCLACHVRPFSVTLCILPFLSYTQVIWKFSPSPNSTRPLSFFLLHAFAIAALSFWAAFLLPLLLYLDNSLSFKNQVSKLPHLTSLFWPSHHQWKSGGILMSGHNMLCFSCF